MALYREQKKSFWYQSRDYQSYNECVIWLLILWQYFDIIEAQGYSNFYQAFTIKNTDNRNFIKVIKKTNIPVASSRVIPTKGQVYVFFLYNCPFFKYRVLLVSSRLKLTEIACTEMTAFFAKKIVRFTRITGTWGYIKCVLFLLYWTNINMDKLNAVVFE